MISLPVKYRFAVRDFHDYGPKWGGVVPIVFVWIETIEEAEKWLKQINQNRIAQEPGRKETAWIQDRESVLEETTEDIMKRKFAFKDI